MALNSLFCADVPLSNYSLTQLRQVLTCYRPSCYEAVIALTRAPAHVDTAQSSALSAIHSAFRRRFREASSTHDC